MYCNIIIKLVYTSLLEVVIVDCYYDILCPNPTPSVTQGKLYNDRSFMLQLNPNKYELENAFTNETWN